MISYRQADLLNRLKELKSEASMDVFFKTEDNFTLSAGSDYICANNLVMKGVPSEMEYTLTRTFEIIFESLDMTKKKDSWIGKLNRQVAGINLDRNDAILKIHEKVQWVNKKGRYDFGANPKKMGASLEVIEPMSFYKLRFWLQPL